jgi:hypothetical protein
MLFTDTARSGVFDVKDEISAPRFDDFRVWPLHIIQIPKVIKSFKV